MISFFFQKDDTVGSVNTSDEQKRELARASIAYNAADKTFTSLFGSTGDAAELFAEADAQIARRKAVAMGTAGGTGATVTATPMTVLTGSMAGAKIASAP